MTVAETYEPISKTVIEATSSPLEVLKAFKISEITKCVTILPSNTVTPLYNVMNKKMNMAKMMTFEKCLKRRSEFFNWVALAGPGALLCVAVVNLLQPSEAALAVFSERSQTR